MYISLLPISLTLDTVFICTVVRALNGKIKGTCTNFKSDP